ncbi:unnamed protein product, partial [Protopolystoma xenopodis]
MQCSRKLLSLRELIKWKDDADDADDAFEPRFFSELSSTTGKPFEDGTARSILTRPRVSSSPVGPDKPLFLHRKRDCLDVFGPVEVVTSARPRAAQSCSQAQTAEREEPNCRSSSAFSLFCFFLEPRRASHLQTQVNRSLTRLPATPEDELQTVGLYFIHLPLPTLSPVANALAQVVCDHWPISFRPDRPDCATFTRIGPTGQPNVNGAKRRLEAVNSFRGPDEKPNRAQAGLSLSHAWRQSRRLTVC